MKYVKTAVLFLCCAILLCGCQEAPKEVKENMKEYGDNPQVETSKVTYCSPQELKDAKLPEIIGNNLEFSGEVDFSDVEGVELLHLSLEEDFLSEDNIGKYMSLFEADKEKIEEGEEVTGFGKELHYMDEAEQNYVSMLQNGGMVHMAGLSYSYNPNVVEERYSIDREDVSEVEVPLADGEVNLAKICEDTEQWLEENMPIEGIRYKVSDAFVRKMEEIDSKKISLCAEYEYKGIRFDDHTIQLSVEDEDLNQKVLTTHLVVQMDYEESGIPSFFSRNESFVIDSAEPVEQVVDFDSAVRIVNETLSGFGKFDIAEVLPLYALYLDDSSEMPGAGITAKPVYAFLVRKQEEDSELGILKFGYCKNFFLVDMVTGELTTDLNIGRIN